MCEFAVEWQEKGVKILKSLFIVPDKLKMLEKLAKNFQIS